MGRKRSLTTFPVARIKKIMQADEDVGKIATATPALVGKALELLMQNVLRDAATTARDRHTKTISPQHLKHAVEQKEEYDFLRHILAAIPNLDDPNAPRTSRRGKRARVVPAASGSGSPRTRAPRIKRSRAPQALSIAPTPASSKPPTPKKEEDNTKVEISSPEPVPDGSAPDVQPQPSESNPTLSLVTKQDDSQEEDEDYDECEEDEEGKEEPSPQIQDGDSTPHPATQTANRVSVRALLS